MSGGYGSWGAGAPHPPETYPAGTVRKFDDVAPPGTTDFSYNPSMQSRSMDPPSQKFARMDNQYSSYTDNWESGYYEESGINNDVNKQYGVFNKHDEAAYSTGASSNYGADQPPSKIFCYNC